MSSILSVYLSNHHDYQSTWDYIRALQPAWVNIHQPNARTIWKVQQHAPNAKIMLRSWDIDDHNGDRKREMYADPKGAAHKHIQMWANKLDEWLGELQRNNWHYEASKWYLGLVNEPDPSHVPQVVEYSLEAMRIMEIAAVPLPLGLVASSVGTFSKPSENDHGWAKFKPLEQPINDGGHILLVHEYWEPKGPNFGEDGGNLAWRHRHIPLNVPILIREAGANGFIFNRYTDKDDGGWQHYMDAPTYAAQVREYIEGCDSRVQGVCLYMTDYHNEQWRTFDTTPAHGHLLGVKDARPKVPSPFSGKSHTTHLPHVAKTQSNANERNDPTPLPPLVHPVTNPAYRIVTQGWGERPDYYSRFAVDGVPLKGHNGLDFGTPIGTVIAAVDGGRVVEVADDPEGYGLYVKLSHAWGESLYAHLRDQLVQVGEWANKGQFVGKSGNTGNSTGPHLHFGLRVAPFNRRDGWGGFVDPSPYLKTDAAPLPRITNEHLLTLIKAAAQEFGLEWQLIASLAWAESSWNPRATSKAGARGLLQLMPDTWNEWRDKVGGTDIFDPAQNLRVGSAYLAWLTRYLKGDVYKALLAYVWGIGNVNMKLTPPADAVAYANKIVHGRDLLKAVGA